MIDPRRNSTYERPFTREGNYLVIEVIYSKCLIVRRNPALTASTVLDIFKNVISADRRPVVINLTKELSTLVQASRIMCKKYKSFHTTTSRVKDLGKAQLKLLKSYFNFCRSFFFNSIRSRMLKTLIKQRMLCNSILDCYTNAGIISDMYPDLLWGGEYTYRRGAV